MTKKAIRIGELLLAQKDECKHGEWMPWIEDNLVFSSRTARRYIDCFHRKMVGADQFASITDTLGEKPRHPELKSADKMSARDKQKAEDKIQSDRIAQLPDPFEPWTSTDVLLLFQNWWEATTKEVPHDFQVEVSEKIIEYLHSRYAQQFKVI